MSGGSNPGESVTLDDGAADEFLPGTAEALLTRQPAARIGTSRACLRALDRYAYGCLEQTTSRALPLLYVEEVARLWRTDPGPATAETLDRAIGHIVELQRSDGSFGVWSDTGDTVPWLDAYATDFLIRAKEHGKNVPGFRDQGGASPGCAIMSGRSTPRSADLPAMAYAHYVLARAKSDDLDGAALFQRYADGASCRPSSPRRRSPRRSRNTAMRRAPPPPMTRRSVPPPPRPAGDPLCRLRQRSARQRRGAVLCRRQSRQSRPRLTAVIDRIAERFSRAAPHQHAGAGLAVDGGRGGGQGRRRRR